MDVLGITLGDKKLIDRSVRGISDAAKRSQIHRREENAGYPEQFLNEEEELYASRIAIRNHVLYYT